jgi:hypothetical protein
MSTTSVFDWSTTAGSNTDVAGNGIGGSDNISLGNDVFQNIMAQVAAGLIGRGSDIATASTLSFTGASTRALTHDLTGTTTVTAVTLTAGHWRICRAQGAFQLTASSTLVVNGSTSTNYTTTAGDLLVFFGYSSSTVRVWTFSGGTAAAATTSAAGIVQLATTTEALTGTNATKAVTPAGLYFPTGHLYGGQVTNNAGSAANKLDIAAATARDSTDTYNMVLSALTAKDITSAWAVGSSAGFLDTGSVANTTYYVYLIKRLDTNVVDAIASTSSSSPTLPTNYTVYSKPIAYFVRAAATNGIPTLTNQHPQVEMTGGAPVYACRAWANFNGTGTTIRASGNVSSIVHNGTGDWTVNFTTSLADANYCALGFAGNAATSNQALNASVYATGSLRVLGGTPGSTPTVDFTFVNVAVMR